MDPDQSPPQPPQRQQHNAWGFATGPAPVRPAPGGAGLAGGVPRGHVADAAVRPPQPPTFQRCAPLLVGGLVLVFFVAGPVTLLLSALIRSASDGSAEPSQVPALVVGALISTAGLVMVLVGLWRLGGHVDDLARDLWDRAGRGVAPVEPPAG